MSISKVGRWLGAQAKFLVAIALAAMIGGVTTAGVLAAIPDADGKIYACYSNGVLGRVKIIDNATQTCGNNETAINWSQNGSAKGVLVDNTSNNNFSGAHWLGWDLRNINFSGSSLDNTDLRASDLRGATLAGTHLTGAVLERANLSGQDFTDTNLSNTQLTGANLNDVTFANANLNLAVLNLQDLSGVNFSNISNLEGISLSGANFSSVTLPVAPNFKSANFTGANLDNNDLTGANFAGAHLEDATLVGSNLTNVVWVEDSLTAYCPDGTLASDHGDTCIGHL